MSSDSLNKILNFNPFPPRTQADIDFDTLLAEAREGLEHKSLHKSFKKSRARKPHPTRKLTKKVSLPRKKISKPKKMKPIQAPIELLQIDEIKFLKSLDVLDSTWGYANRTNYEKKTHNDGYPPVQMYTDPLFRTIDKVKYGDYVDNESDVYNKLKRCSELNNVQVELVQEAFEEPGFYLEMLKLSKYPSKSTAMRVITEFANALLEINDNKPTQAHTRMVKLRFEYATIFGWKNINNL